MAEQPRRGFPITTPADPPAGTGFPGFPNMAPSPASVPEVAQTPDRPALSPLAVDTVPPKTSPGSGREAAGDTWWERLRFEMTDALTSGSLSDRLVRASSGVEAPITTGRRIVVVGVSGGSGTTTVAALMAKLYGSIRQEAVLAVDATDQAGQLLHYLGTTDRALLSRLVHQLRTSPARTLSDATKSAAPCGNQIFAVGRSDVPALPDEPLAPGEWTDVSSTLSRFMAVTIVDAGSSALSAQTAGLLETAHAVVVVAPETGLGRDRLGSVLQSLESAHPHSAYLGVRVQSRHGSLLAPDALPFDRHLAGGAGIRLSRLGSRTRIAAMEIAANALSAANKG